ncbi:hypothetical protein HC028_05775 [Planosporangium flavigriseum]|uniref:Uncharacterized protein n=1 Tax=Planosporangium flavigriseum TaxID=373681 RepID=A0A8J3PK23_9ACTN|nr:hypothetical protein [Planosporangium flavigriseum]NJC64020.1 hypothetical protein [Planosporangium flavigriseum]GIG72901.1 hypothetical protein Pfl04_13050 [Planosporangium flavigriseum]
MTPEPDAVSRQERVAIQEAMDRLLRGEPRQSDGALTVMSLVRESGLKRHHLTHKHTDLQAEFRRRVAELNAEPVKVTELREELAALQAKYAERGEQLRNAEGQVRQYAENLAVAVLQIDRLERQVEDLVKELSEAGEGRPHLRPV